MSGCEKTHGPHAGDPEQTICETEADVHSRGERPVENQAGAEPTSKGVATYREFADALIGIGLIDAASLERYAADSAEGVLGLSRALVKAGWITPYQAAAVYQNKSRGLLIGNYLILDKIGQGGMGMVFKARHRELGRFGALKILPPSFTRDRGAVTRFRREFEVAAALKHLNVVAAFEADEDRGVHFLVMEYVAGTNLDQFVREHGPLLVQEAVDYLIQSARGLEAAHEKGIIHRDIKPGNLMLDCAATVRVLDLGLARIIDASNPFSKSVEGRLTQSGTYMGSIDYMAPEQAEDAHSADHRADIYSLGCTFFFLLTGRQPFAGQSMLKRLVAHQEHPAPSLRAIRPEVSPAVEAAYQKMMAKRPEDRPASMTEVIALFQASKHATDNEMAQSAALPVPKPAREVSHGAPQQEQNRPRTIVDSVIFTRRADVEGTSSDNELNLRDLIMDVRSDVCIPDESDSAEDEPVGVSDELNLRELALELREEAAVPAQPKPPAAAQPLKRGASPRQEATPLASPKLPAAAAQPLKRGASPRQEVTPLASPILPAVAAQPIKGGASPRQEATPLASPKLPAAAAQPLVPAVSLREQETPPAAPKPPAGDARPMKSDAALKTFGADLPPFKPAAHARPMKSEAALRQQETPAAASKPPAGDVRPLKSEAALKTFGADLPPFKPAADARPLKRPTRARHEDAPPTAPSPPSPETERLKPAALIPFGELIQNKGFAILAVVTAVLLVVALALFLSRRPATVIENEKSTPVQSSDERADHSAAAQPPPL